MILDEEMKGKVVEVIRKSDRIIKVRVILQDKVLNIVSAYVPQMRYKEDQIEEFWQEMDEIIQEIEDIVIERDMNGHVGCDRIDYDREYGFGERNEDEKKYLIL